MLQLMPSKKHRFAKMANEAKKIFDSEEWMNSLMVKQSGCFVVCWRVPLNSHSYRYNDTGPLQCICHN